MAKAAKRKKKNVKGLLNLPRRTLMMGVGVVMAAFLAGAGTVAVFAWSPPDQPSPTPVATTGLNPPEKKPTPVPVVSRSEPPEAPPPILRAPEIVPPPPPAPSAPPPPAYQGVPPWQLHALPTTPKNGWKIAVVIDDAGLDHHRTARIIALPGPLTVSFLTYGDGLVPQVRAARAAGHELMVHVAMQATSRTVDPGPDVLLRDIEPDEILARLVRVLSKFDGYVGINNHMGSLFTSDTPSMQIVLGELKRRGLLFLDSRTSPESVGGKVARSLELPYAERDVFLDNDPIESKVGHQLIELERVARAKGAAIAIGHPRDGTIEALAKWIPDAKARGFVFVPVSALVKDNVRALSARR
jgi:uncharacterized protein